MKLENCGRCGLEAETVCEDRREDYGFFYPALYGCPVVHDHEPMTYHEWNAAQFAARTKRINKIAGKMIARDMTINDDKAVAYAAIQIDAQDAAARVRWAEMQKGE